MYCVHSTTTNCPPAPPPPGESAANDQPGTSTGGQAGEEEDTPGKKRKTKSEQVREEQFNKLLKVAEQDDHPVDLALAALGKQMIRTLSQDEQDELLEDLHAVSDKFFREHRRRLRVEKTAVAVAGANVEASGPPPAQLPCPPPPPLLRAGQHQPQVQQVQAATVSEMGAGDMLVELQDIPPMQQYNVEYVRGVEGTTYMKL